MRASVAATVAALALAACVPNPQSVKERRQSFDREGLKKSGLILDAPPPGMNEIGAVFGDRIKLVGYTTNPVAPKRGDDVAISFYWSALKPVPEEYQVFVHGDAISGNARRIHGDHYPASGKYPTDLWQEGELVVDTFNMSVPSAYQPERLGVFTGMYRDDYRVPLTSRGVGVSDAENRSRAIELVLGPSE